MAWSRTASSWLLCVSTNRKFPNIRCRCSERDYIPAIIIINNPKAGEKNSKVTLHSYDVTTKDTKELKVPVEADSYIPRIVFTNNDDQLAVMTLNRHQNVFNMYYANPKSGVFSFDPA